MVTRPATVSVQPWLLYSYPWMPYPRRVQIYLREKSIPSSAVTIVHVSDPQKGDCVVPSQADNYPPRPVGSLPILAIPPQSSEHEWIYVRQSMAIIEYLEEATENPDGPLSHLRTRALHIGGTSLERARLTELKTLAEELTVSWNPVRMFGTGAGTMKYPEGAKEMYRWVSRAIARIDQYMAGRDCKTLEDEGSRVSVADITLYQFLEFVDYCYGIDVTEGSGGEALDVYGRHTKEVYPNLKAFYQAFRTRKSTERIEEAGELASKDVLKRMRTWHDGVR